MIVKSRCGTKGGDQKLQGARAHVGDVAVARDMCATTSGKGCVWRQLQVEELTVSAVSTCDADAAAETASDRKT